MFNPKSTIYQTEWLELVFANRNKSYGAYELRQNADKRLVRALLISSLFVAVVFSYPIVKRYFFKPNDLPPIEQPMRPIVVDLPPPLLPKKEPLAPASSAPKAEPVKSIRNPPPEVVSTPVTEEPPKAKDLATAIISTQTVDGPVTTGNISVDKGTGNGKDGPGQDEGTAVDNTVHSGEFLQSYPEFPGGMEAFAKYLRKNLRYPTSAIEAGIAGKVFVSFVVEKDGRLTDIKVLRGIGYGCDEEATRVLKKSPSWKPGIQNNREVRVLYTIPLVFHMEE